MSHPSWLPPKSTNEPVGHITARMETTHTFGTPSISVSTQQTPKKFAPVVAPKPKYNPYKQPGGDGKYSFSEETTTIWFRRTDCYSEELTANIGCSGLTLCDEFVGPSLFKVIQMKKNVKLSLIFALANYSPEGCRAWGDAGAGFSPF